MSSLIPVAKQKYWDSNGDPLIGGKVHFYGANSTTPQTTWSDQEKTQTNPNPVILDNRGEAFVFGEGRYAVKVTDSNDNLIWEKNNVSSLTSSADLASEAQGLGSNLIAHRPNSTDLSPRSLSEVANGLLFDLNTGLREDVVCSLRWEWELKINLRKDLQISVFVIPRANVKGRKSERIVICNSVAQALVDSQRGLHPEMVFTYWRPKKGFDFVDVKHHKINFINNTAWQKAVKRAHLDDLHVHDLRHTVGMRLRLTGVAERTQEVILWHSNSSMNSHYAIAQLREIYTALDGISMPGHDEESLTLHAMIRQAQIRAVGKVTQKSRSNKKAA